MISTIGLINGITVIVWLILGLIWGFVSIYRAYKTKSKYLFFVGMIVIFISLLFLGLVSDFISIIVIGKNLDNSYGLHGILTYVWFGPLVFFLYLLADIVLPDITPYLKKILSIYIFILCLIYEIFLFMDPFGSIRFKYPENSGENLIDNTIIEWSPLFILLGMTLFPALIIGGTILLYQSVKTSGIVRKKLLLIFLAVVLFFGFGSIDLLVYLPDIPLIVIRYIMISGGILFYFGIKEETVNIEKEPFKKKSEFDRPKISLVTTLSRPEDLTQEDILYFREQTLCMVCKTLMMGFVDVFICPECKALYCENCARELIQIDNMCWGCLGPIDESKPVKSHKEEEEEDLSILDISKKPLKKAKKDTPISKINK